MKQTWTLILTLLLTAAILIGCSTTPDVKPTESEPPVTAETEETEETTEAATQESSETMATDEEEKDEEDFIYEGDASSYYIDVAYAEQIARYYTALAEQWDESKYLDNGMSPLPAHYYEGNPLENVGFDFVDLDNDGHLELIIGAILNAEQDPSVFEIWTLVDGNPVMLAQGGSHNRYVLHYAEEDCCWYIVNEASSSAACHATYDLMLCEGRLEVIQGILFDATADEKNPWFMTYDMDWDVANDDPIDEDMANSILQSYRSQYIALEYFPYIYYK